MCVSVIMAWIVTKLPEVTASSSVVAPFVFVLMALNHWYWGFFQSLFHLCYACPVLFLRYSLCQWTGWTLLVALALYDLCAVLTPCGPLKQVGTKRALTRSCRRVPSVFC